jgi:hypothetical protein
MLILLLAACGQAPTPVSPTPPSSPTSEYRIITPPAIRATLPPTFTPTSTPTNLPPPTRTNTPAPTGTSTPIPVADLCEKFAVAPGGPDGLLYRSGTRLFTLTFIIQVEDAVVHFRAVHDDTGQTVENTYVSELLIELRLDPQTMPASGRYTWYLTVTQGGRTGLCEQTGFMVIDNTPLPIAEVTAEATGEVTPESTPEITPEATPESTAEITPESTAESTLEATPEITPESTAEVTPESTAEVTPESRGR